MAKGSAEESAHLADVAFGDELADRLEEMALAADGLRRSRRVHGEAEFAAKGFQAVDVGLGVIAETEVFSFVEFDDVQGVLQDVGGEGPGGHLREFFGEGQDEDGVDAG